MKLTILIPCLNEAETIEKAVDLANEAARKYVKEAFEVVVADDGSTDGSVEKVKRRGKARLVSVPIKGYGATLHWGIMSALGEYVLFADADLSYPFEEVKKFIPYMKQKTDLVLGSRYSGVIEKGAMPWLNRRIGTPVLTRLINIFYGLGTTDCNSGMRMIRKDFYRELNMKNAGMEWASELLIKTALKRGKYTEVAIRFCKDQRKRVPHLSRWSDGWRHLKAIVLLKPDALLWPTGLFIIAAVWWWNKAFGLAYFWGILAAMLFFSYLASKVLYFAINKQIDETATAVIVFPGVLTAIVVTLGSVAYLGWGNGSEQINVILAGTVIIYDMWVFLIETIKTHLINRLPDNKE